MSTVYVNLIIKGLKTFDQVPVKLQEEVEQQLNEMGLDKNGNQLTEE